MYRRNHIKDNLIPLLPRGGYRNLHNQSRTAIEWLEFESFKTGLHTAHAKNGREKRIGCHTVDGFCEQCNTVYGFLGCYWHACPEFCRKKITCRGRRCSEGKIRATPPKNDGKTRLYTWHVVTLSSLFGSVSLGEWKRPTLIWDISWKITVLRCDP